MKKIMVLGVIFFIVLLIVLVGCSKKETTIPTGKFVQSVERVVQSVERSCEDSDEGIVAEQAGKVSGVINGEEYVYYDKCFPPSSILIEYYCENGEVKNQNIRCPSGTRCLGGACRKL